MSAVMDRQTKQADKTTPEGHIFRWACFDNDGHAHRLRPDDISAPMGNSGADPEQVASYLLVEKCIVKLGRGTDPLLSKFLKHVYWKGERRTAFRIVRVVACTPIHESITLPDGSQKSVRTGHHNIAMPELVTRQVLEGLYALEERLLKLIEEGGNADGE